MYHHKPVVLNSGTIFKWCFACNCYKPIEKFGNDKSKIDLHVSICKDCHGPYQKASQHEYYMQHRDELLPKHRVTAKASYLRKKEATHG